MHRTASTVALALATLAAAPALAQAPVFEGRYALLADQSDDIGEAIDRAVRDMNFIVRPIARSRLRGTNPAYATVEITRQGGDVLISFDARRPTVSPTDGTVAEWTREDGEQLRVSTLLSDDSLTQTFHAEDGQRQNVYTLSPDGATLSLDVTITSPRLDEPLTYTLRYRRAD